MENTSDFFSVIFNYQKTLGYFSEFHHLLQDLNYDLEFRDVSKFFQCLQFTLKNNFFDIYADEINREKFYCVLLEIFDALCLKCFDNVHNYDVKVEKTSIFTHLFDSVTLLIKILIPKFSDKISLKSVFNYIAVCFHTYSYDYQNAADDDDFVKEQFGCLLKFFVNILKSLGPDGISIHISDNVLTPILQSFPFSYKYALNLYVNQIVPSLFSGCDYNIKKQILELMWQKIITDYKEDYCSNTESTSNLLLCCFSDYMFQESYELKNFSLCDDIWKLIQSNLTFESSYKRKQALYVFKMILFWIKSNNYVTSVPLSCENVPIFAISAIKDLLIWNDIVILFETLEEKQIHVIKPILPKFSRIIQQASKKCDENSFILHPSWITCLIKRMIFHENKFIRKQALSIAMRINFKESTIHELHSKEFIKTVIGGFNDQNMYCRMNEHNNLSLYLSSEKIACFLTVYIQAFGTESQKASFMRYLLEVTACNSWCGVALMHLTFALTQLESLSSWQNEDILHIRNIIQGCLKSHESIIRRAIEYWLLKSCIIFVDWKSLSFEDLAELLFTFKTFQRHTVIWNALVSKLKDIFSRELLVSLSISNAKEFAFSCANKILAQNTAVGKPRPSKNDIQKMALLLALLADCGVISFNLEENTLSWFRLLQPVTSVLMDIQKRPYISQDKFYNALQFYTIVLDTALESGRDINEKHSSAIISCLNCSIEFLEFIFQKSLMDIKGSDDIINFQILFNSLHTLSSVTNFKEMFVKLLPSFLINYNHIPAHFLSKKIIIILLFEFSNNQLHDNKFSNKAHLNPFRELSFNFLSKILTESVINDLLKTVFVNEMEKEVWQKLVVLYINKFWKTASVIAKSLSHSVQKDLILGLFQLAEDIFDGGSKTTYSSTISCIGILIPKLGLSNMHIVEKLLNVAYKACSELQGCEAYRPAIESFIKTIFQPFMLNETCFDTLNKYINCFQNISENSLGIFYLVIKQFCNTFPLAHLYKMNFNYIPLIIYSLTYGPIHQKSQKILEDSIAAISDQDEYFSEELKNYNKPSVFVRVTAIAYLMNNLYKKSTESEEIALQIINALLSLDKNTRASRSTFVNSYNHRVRNRIWQCILLLQPNVLSESENNNFFKKICELLEFDNQQPSIRYLQEWLILKIINLNKYLVSDFISVVEKSLEKRPGFLVSLLSVLIHLIIHDFLLSEDQVSKCFPVLITYCMAQNFAVRLYSRLALAKLFSACEKNNLTNLIQKYDFLHSLSLPQVSEDSLFEKGNIYRNLIKLQEEFYFSVFHPIKHFTLETIFFELPRLSNLPPEEWIKAEYFKECLSSEFQLIASFNSDSFLKNSSAVSWNAKSDNEPLVENDSYDYNFQKKICPVKSEIYDCIPDAAFESKPKQSNLIVIASLIDKIPNLGGLCRTCEVFGVEQFIIGSLKYKEDKTFQNLAVSSDRWVSIKEVKPYHLKEYLLSLKEGGYTLIGAEQTDDSHKLSNYVFPQKSALILGHEKEGMPVNLIQVLDACVEIPQQGIIRSLNVHVSGAIFIWEYARQQIRH